MITDEKIIDLHREQRLQVGLVVNLTIMTIDENHEGYKRVTGGWHSIIGDL